MLNNIKHPEQETLGKIYYIQAYFNGSITQNVPYMVIDVNHDGTENTVDLRSEVYATGRPAWNSNWNSWSYGKYTTCSFYSWLPNTCPNGYSANIQAKMIEMTERWREATGNATGTMMSRSTKCKLLNPVELFGYSSATYDPDYGAYINSSDHKTDFASPTGDKYGSLYPVWTDSIGALSNRRIFGDLAMSRTFDCWTNSWLGFVSSINSAFLFIAKADGKCIGVYTKSPVGIAPVIRLKY